MRQECARLAVVLLQVLTGYIEQSGLIFHLGRDKLLFDTSRMFSLLLRRRIEILLLFTVRIADMLGARNQ